MVLQKIKFPNPEICSELEMFYRGDLKQEDNMYEIKKGKIIQFNTYFNAFSIEKWETYTRLDNLTLNLLVSGKGKIILKNNFLNNDILKSDTIKTVTFNEKDKKNIEINIEKLKLKGNISFEIEAEENCKIIEGNFSSDIKSKENIHLALCICTFRREEFVRKNMRVLEENIFSNAISELRDNLDVIIVDNAQTLNENEFKNENIHYIKNKNLGGSGGFTRGIIEAKFRSNKNITHCILMDDDIVLDSDVIEKTYAFLSILKEEYKDYMFGGAMIVEDERYMQAVSGEFWKDNNKIMRNTNVDLRNETNILKNEIEYENNFNGWFYCCIPTDTITDKNLPLPIFIHMDDVEYGVRNSKGLILLNGICIWHPNLFNKGPMTNIYYNIRNELIIKSKYAKNIKMYTKMHLLAFIVYYTSQYRYSEAELALKAYTDFYSGIDNFKKIDGEKLHKELMSFKHIDEKKKSCVKINMNPQTPLSKIFTCIVGIISYIMPKFKKEKVYTSNIMVVSSCFSKEITVYDVNSEMSYSLKRDYKKMYNCFKEYRKICKIINKSNKKINNEWKDKYDEITNLDFWKKYLELN